MTWEVEILRDDTGGKAGQMFQDKIQLDKDSSVGSCSKPEVGEAGCWGKSYQEKRRFGVAVIDNVWSYLADIPSYEEEDLLRGKKPAMSLSFLPAFAPGRKSSRVLHFSTCVFMFFLPMRVSGAGTVSGVRYEGLRKGVSPILESTRNLSLPILQKIPWPEN